MKELEENLIENKKEIINTNNLKLENNILKDFLRITISDSKTNNILLKTLYNILN